MKISLSKSKFVKGVAFSIFCALFTMSFFSVVPVAYAACSDAQVDRWLSDNGKARNGNSGEDLIQAYRALGDCSNAAGGKITSIVPALNRVIEVLNLFIPFLIGLAVFIIIYGIFGFISSAGDEEKRKEARDFIMWGVFGVFLMLSVWGLVAIVLNVFNLDNNAQVLLDANYKVVELKTDAASAPKTVPELVARLIIIGNYIIRFLISIAVFVIILGLFNYIREGDNEEKRAESRRFVIWGVISVFLMLSIWGLVNIVVGTFNFDSAAPSLKDIFSHLKIE